MYLEIISFFFLLSFPIAIIIILGRSGYWGELTKLYAKKLVKNDFKKLLWTPIFIEQKGKPKIVFLSITKIGIVDNQLLISYIFPFHLLLSPIEIRKNIIESSTEEKKLGKKFIKLRLKKLNNGAIFLPMKMKIKLEEMISNDCDQP